MRSKAAHATSLERFKAQLQLTDCALAATAEDMTIPEASLPDNPPIYATAGFERLSEPD
jgi:hypothetical protein